MSPNTDAQIARDYEEENFGDHDGSKFDAREYRSPSKSRSSSSESRSYQESPAVASREIPEPDSIKPIQLDYKLLHSFDSHFKAVSSVKFSPDGQRIASCSADGTIKVWNIQPPSLELTFEGHLSGVSIIAWSPDSKWIASGADDKVIRLWNITTGKAHPCPFLGHSNYVYSLAFSPKGNMLVSGSHDEAVFLWDVRAARRIRSLPAHSDPVGGVDFAHDGTLIVSCSSDGLIRTWDTATGQCLRTIIHQDHAPVTSVRFSPNGKFILAWTLDSSLRLWDYVNNRCVKTYQGHDNTKFSIGGSFGTYFKYGKAYETANSEYREPPAAFIVSGSEDGSLWIWDVITKGTLQTIPKAHDGVIFGADAHPFDQMLVTGGADGKVKIWRHQIPPNMNTVSNGEFSHSPDLDPTHGDRALQPDAMDLDEPIMIKTEEVH